jgi:hypothetical protein
MSSQFWKYTFKELKRATQRKTVYWNGWFRPSGTVYKGKLKDETVVPIKKLKDGIQGEMKIINSRWILKKKKNNENSIK